MDKELELTIWQEIDRCYENTAILPNEWKGSATAEYIHELNALLPE